VIDKKTSKFSLLLFVAAADKKNVAMWYSNLYLAMK